MKLENERACEACDQLGEMIENPCNTCKGKGRVVKRTTLNIKVPCGVEAGMTLNIEGQGHAGLRGGLTGDLHVEISVESSPHFTISGRNLIYNAKLAFPQAVLGDKIWIPVPTPTGMTLKPFEFKGGASSGQQLGSLAGFGRPWVDNADRRGNIVVVCEVVVPKEPSEKEKELLKQYLDLVKKGEASQEYK
jgi:molecular chaperone DnaJ